MKLKRYIIFSAIAMSMYACQRGPNDPGTEYAPNMYVSVAYEPYSMVKDSINKINPYGINLREPAQGTVARRNYKTTYKDETTGEEYDLGLMVYRTHPDSLEQAAKTLKNPLKITKQVLAEGKVLYEYYCQHCHGAEGKGDGKVGQKYGGVANLAGGQIAKVNGGHIFHVITHGKGRMWPHGSQINPLERWKIVSYVHLLQGQIDADGNPIVKEEKKEEKKEETKK
ncbi:MAG: cytochrome c [Raineya sp.]|nr:cytochrome c [Raineya sp.]